MIDEKKMEDKIQEFISAIIQKTIQKEIFWETISELSTTESGFPDIVNQTARQFFMNEFRQILHKNSFFFYHQGGVVALIRIDNTSGKDGSHSCEFALAMQIRPNIPPCAFDTPELQESLSSLYTAILNYLSRDLKMPDDLYTFMQF